MAGRGEAPCLADLARRCAFALGGFLAASPIEDGSLMDTLNTLVACTCGGDALNGGDTFHYYDPTDTTCSFSFIPSGYFEDEEGSQI